jgi:uncharacterized protein DUF6980
MRQHCCATMTSAVHLDRYDCPDALIVYIAKFDEYDAAFANLAFNAIYASCGTAIQESFLAISMD